MPHEVDDIEEREFEAALAAKRHKEQMSSLKGIASLLNKPQKENDNKEVTDAIKQNSELTKELIKAVKEIPQAEKAELKVETNQDKVISSLEKICKEICDSNEKVIAALNNKMIVDEFKLEKDQWGNTKTVKVIYKNDYLNMKNKYQA